MQRHTPVYRPILKHALETAWIHRELWPIAAVAGLAGTGAVINDVLNQAKLAASIPTSQFAQTFGNLHALDVYRDSLVFVSPEQITLGTVIVLGVGALVVMAVAACQHVMLRAAHNALKQKRHLSLTEIRHEFVHPRIGRFLALDLFLKLLVVNLMIATTVLVANLRIGTVVSDAFFGVIFSAAALSLALSLNVIVMLALIGVARKNLGLGQSLAYAWNLYRKNSFICLEMSLILFAINFLISAAYDGTILVLGVPAVLAFISALETGSFFIYISAFLLVAILAITLTLAFAGFATTFTYATWTALAEHLDKKALTPRVVAHTKRFFASIR